MGKVPFCESCGRDICSCFCNSCGEFTDICYCEMGVSGTAISETRIDNPTLQSRSSNPSRHGGDIIVLHQKLRTGGRVGSDGKKSPLVMDGNQ